MDVDQPTERARRRMFVFLAVLLFVVLVLGLTAWLRTPHGAVERFRFGPLFIVIAESGFFPLVLSAGPHGPAPGS